MPIVQAFVFSLVNMIVKIHVSDDVMDVNRTHKNLKIQYLVLKLYY